MWLASHSLATPGTEGCDGSILLGSPGTAAAEHYATTFMRYISLSLEYAGIAAGQLPEHFCPFSQDCMAHISGKMDYQEDFSHFPYSLDEHLESTEQIFLA